MLGGLVLFSAFAVLGYATFGVHPELLASYPGATAAYGTALRIFPLGQVWLAFAVLAGYLTMQTGWRWTGSFLLLYLLSLSSELLGTGYGIPFGPYHYSAMLGPEWMGRVPALIPLSWFSMSVAAYAIAPRSNARGPRGTVTRIAFASLLLLCWDLSLDPAMSHATTFWVWGASGPYYGMPWSNLVGWYATGVVLATALWAAGADRWESRLSRRWIGMFYGANVLLALGMNLAAGLWLAALATGCALAATWAAIAVIRERLPHPAGAGAATDACAPPAEIA